MSREARGVERKSDPLAGRASRPSLITAMFTGVGAVLCASAVVVVIAGVVLSLTDAPLNNRQFSLPLADLPLLARTLGIAVLIGALAAALGFPAAWSMRRLGVRWSALLLAPMLLPNHLVYASWGLLRAPGTWLGDALQRAGGAWTDLASAAQAIGGLSLWAWPIAAAILAASATRLSDEMLDSLRLSPAPRWRKALAVAGAMRGSLIGAVAVVALVMLGSAVPLHVAQVETYAIVIWRELAATAGAAQVWLAASPLLVIAAIGGWLIGGRLLGAGRLAEADWRGGERSSPAAGWIIAAACIWAMSTLVPFALFLTSLRQRRSLIEFWPLTGEALAASASLGAVVGALGLLIATASHAVFSSPAGSVSQRLGAISLRAWLMLALAPGVLVGSAVLSAGRFEWSAWLSDTRAGMVLAHVARFGAVAALLGWWTARAESRELRDLRRLEAGGSVIAWLRTTGHAQAAAFLGAGLALFALSLHEIESAVVLAPPGAANLPQNLLNKLHYLRVEELSAAGVYLLAGGIIIAVAATLSVSLGRASRPSGVAQNGRDGRSTGALLLSLGALPFLLGCDDRADAGEPIDTDVIIGGVGRSPGRFIYPRAIDTDGESLWIIDKTARVQRLTPDGEYLSGWKMPEYDRGMPTGVTCGPDGRIYVADTHEHRVAVFRPSGELVETWGEYGEAPGQFIYPTDVAIDPAEDGKTAERIYVSEYGGNDRISVFDADRSFLFSFGEPGSSASPENVRFARPQSMAYDETYDELIVTDSSNHRLGRFTRDGELLGWIGRDDAMPGEAPGQFRYPYGLDLLSDGSALVSEYGGNRVQRIDPRTGESLGIFGVAGRGVGEMATPWGVVAIGRRAFALDSGNNRAQGFDLPGGARGTAP